MTTVSNNIAPLVGVTVSESPDMGALGLSAGHVRGAMEHVAQQVLSSGRSLAYGGDLQPGDFTDLLAHMLVRYRGHPQHSSTVGVFNYVAWPTHIRMAPDELTALVDAHKLDLDLVFLSQDGRSIEHSRRLKHRSHEPDGIEWVRGLTNMREFMRDVIDARIVLGGRVDVYKGAAPDIAEEVHLSLAEGQPVYLIGGFGGCARYVAESIGLVDRWAGSPERWAGDGNLMMYSPDDLRNGLSLDENKLLARTTDIQEAVALVMKGLRQVVGTERKPIAHPVQPGEAYELEGEKSRFRLHGVRLTNYRCFEELELNLERDTTVIFAENGGGKTALLNALALGLDAFLQGIPRRLELDFRRDRRMRSIGVVGMGVRREPLGDCGIVWTAEVGEADSVTWSKTAPIGRRVSSRYTSIEDAMGRVWVPGHRWPMFAWYGVDRLRRSHGTQRVELENDRWEAYASSLDPNLDDAALLQWLQNETLGQMMRERHDQPVRPFHDAVMAAVVRATPAVTDAWYDPATQKLCIHFGDDHAVEGSELSDGYHAYVTLVADIARRAVMLNEIDGDEALDCVQGVVLIDELDLHLHPRWQREALSGLRRAFPRLQFVITTHSPQVLSSAKNRQVRWLVDGALREASVFVEGRDTNAILREHMHTDDRDAEGVRALRALYHCIGKGQQEEAAALYKELLARWGDVDPELIRANGFMDLDE